MTNTVALSKQCAIKIEKSFISLRPGVNNHLRQTFFAFCTGGDLRHLVQSFTFFAWRHIWMPDMFAQHLLLCQLLRRLVAVNIDVTDTCQFFHLHLLGLLIFSYYQLSKLTSGQLPDAVSSFLDSSAFLPHRQWWQRWIRYRCCLHLRRIFPNSIQIY